MAMDFAKKGVRVNLVSPGMTETDLISDVPQKSRLLIEAKCPRHRLAKPADVANAIYYLASEDADYLTGETIRVNGGMVML
jgi:3-oxoacyl-[acyl-carrier protein] reductase